jgi:hypothetical protein
VFIGCVRPQGECGRACRTPQLSSRLHRLSRRMRGNSGSGSRFSVCASVATIRQARSGLRSWNNATTAKRGTGGNPNHRVRRPTPDSAMPSQASSVYAVAVSGSAFMRRALQGRDSIIHGAIPRPKDDQPKVRPRRLAHTERGLNDPSPRDEYRVGDVP